MFKAFWDRLERNRVRDEGVAALQNGAKLVTANGGCRDVVKAYAEWVYEGNNVDRLMAGMVKDEDAPFRKFTVLPASITLLMFMKTEGCDFDDEQRRYWRSASDTSFVMSSTHLNQEELQAMDGDVVRKALGDAMARLARGEDYKAAHADTPLADLAARKMVGADTALKLWHAKPASEFVKLAEI